MTEPDQIITALTRRENDQPLYLPDFTLWYDWHRRQRTLPAKWRDFTLAQIADAMGVPTWLPASPWRVEHHGAAIIRSETNGERIIRSETSEGTLVARWIRGPDGDWWQTEYPVKTPSDLKAARALVEARTYALDVADQSQLQSEKGGGGLVPLEIPRAPYSDLLHEFLGWSEGLMLLGEPLVDEIIRILDEKLQRLVDDMAGLPGSPGAAVLSPDNLDGQFISPRAFKAHLAPSYRRICNTLHGRDMALVVHVGGPVRHLLALLASAGVDAIEGIAGPPQGNTTLAESRDLTGQGLILWGGIPQDFLLDTYSRQEFEVAVEKATHEACADRYAILGIADRVPVSAELSRLEDLEGLVKRAAAPRY